MKAQISLAAFGLVSAVAVAAPADAQLLSKPYVTAGAGYIDTNDFGDGSFAMLGVGTRLPLGFRTDITALYQTGLGNEASAFDSDLGVDIVADQEIDIYTGFVSAYYDLPEGIPFVEPYIGAGVGGSVVDQDVTLRGNLFGESFSESESDTSSDFSYHASAGLSLTLAGGIAVDAGYRYVVYGDLAGGDSFDANHFTLGGRLGF